MKKIISIFLLSFLVVSCTNKVEKLSKEEISDLPGLSALSGSQDTTAKTEDFGKDTQINMNMSYLSNKGNNVVIFDVNPGQKISSPLKISGMIPTNWVFEGSFPIKIYSMDAKVIGSGIGNANIYDAKGNVITPNVGFEAEIKFELPENMPAGRIELSADNPSGLPENDDSINLPIVF